MKNQRDKLQQYQKKITVITNREQEIAKECLRNGNKQKALLALRRKKYQETLLARTDQQLAQLEALTSDVEFALVQKDVVFGLQQGTKVLKEIHREMGGLERVEMIMGESEEAQAYQKVLICFLRCVVVMLTLCRKYPRCSAAGCRIKRRTKLRKSSKQWKERSMVFQVYRMFPMLCEKRCRMFHKKLLKRERNGEGRRELLSSKLRNPLLHDGNLCLIVFEDTQRAYAALHCHIYRSNENGNAFTVLT